MQGVLIPLNLAGQGPTIQIVIGIGPFEGIYFNSLGATLQCMLKNCVEALLSGKFYRGL